MELKEKVIGNAKNKHVYDKFDAIETTDKRTDVWSRDFII